MKTPTILVIDDDQAMCDSCTRIYEKDEYQVRTAQDGTIGLQRARELKPDIALIDLKMPGPSGMEVLEEIREIDPSIVPIVITGYPSLETAVEAMKKGAYDFLPKPFTPGELRSITQSGLEQRAQVLESESVRRRKQEMQELLISVASHQLRSPLTAVQAYFDLILGDFVPDPPKQKEMIKQASKRIKGLLALINDWLKMAEIDPDRLKEKSEPLDLTSILTEIVGFLQPLAEAKGVSLQIEMSNGLPIVRGDKAILQEVFTNLIDNGIKYNKPGGSVAVSTRETNSDVLIDFSDTGIGISKEDIPFVFDEFFRVKNEDTQETTGTGLGLSIVKRMVEAHSGSVSLTSEVGKGSVFTVTLPKPEKHK